MTNKLLTVSSWEFHPKEALNTSFTSNVSIDCTYCSTEMKSVLLSFFVWGWGWGCCLCKLKKNYIIKKCQTFWYLVFNDFISRLLSQQYCYLPHSQTYTPTHLRVPTYTVGVAIRQCYINTSRHFHDTYYRS